MKEENVATRLKLFIEFKGISSSQFADQSQIPRPSLSQFLTGRNKKISDLFISQIHNAYPELNVLWLLFGEGSMLNSSESYYGSSKKVNSNLTFQEGRIDTEDKIDLDNEGYDQMTSGVDTLGSYNHEGLASGSIRFGFDEPEKSTHSRSVSSAYQGDSGDFSSINSFQNKNSEFTENPEAENLRNVSRYKDAKKNSKESPLTLTENKDKITENEYIDLILKNKKLEEQIAKISKNPRKVVQIMIYYDDSTFETFIPRD
ncbi:MAG: hypothetical protein NC328_05100 [Muribaculum sp.]|nr:hypothetical protein [Muribaculum sp.]